MRRISRLENNARANDVPTMHYRPGVNSYFVGCERELYSLEQKLYKYGSVAVMQFGGVGKSQLTAAFGEKDERSQMVPGGSFWVGAHGDRSQIVHSLADFTESLTKHRFRKEGIGEVDIVLSALRNKLESIVGNWLMFIDNADAPQVNPIVGKIVRLARSAGGWVVVTSRQGGITLWDGMDSEQKLKLKPLNVKQAMIVLYRWNNNSLRDVESDEQIWGTSRNWKKKTPMNFERCTSWQGSKRSMVWLDTRSLWLKLEALCFVIILLFRNKSTSTRRS